MEDREIGIVVQIIKDFTAQETVLAADSFQILVEFYAGKFKRILDDIKYSFHFRWFHA
jgi:hypothetical protein